jgi:hypothetical protein
MQQRQQLLLGRQEVWCLLVGKQLRVRAQVLQQQQQGAVGQQLGRLWGVLWLRCAAG